MIETDEEIPEKKKLLFNLKYNNYYNSIIWLIIFTIVNFVVGYLTFLQMIGNLIGIGMVTIFILIKEGGIKYEFKD